MKIILGATRSRRVVVLDTIFTSPVITDGKVHVGGYGTLFKLEL